MDLAPQPYPGSISDNASKSKSVNLLKTFATKSGRGDIGGRSFSRSIGAEQARPLCQKCARIRCFHAIGVSFERKADSPNY